MWLRQSASRRSCRRRLRSQTMTRRRAMQPENANDNGKDNEEVGFGRPPKQHQFKPKQSGNPKGRPKGPSYSSTEEALARVAHEKREVETRKGTRLVSGFELGVNAMVKNFLEKDVRAAIMFLK